LDVEAVGYSEMLTLGTSDAGTSYLSVLSVECASCLLYGT